MTSWVVADSGIYLAVMLEDPFSEDAGVLIRDWEKQGLQIAAPVLFRYELIAVLRKSVYRRRLTAEEA